MTGSDASQVTILSDKLSLVTHHHLLTRVPVKLDLDDWNYESWEYFFEQLCASYDVTKFLHDDPNATESSTTPPHPRRSKWTKSSSLGYLRPSRTHYKRDNKRSRTSALKAELRSIKLGALSMEAYFQKIDSIVTILTSLGSIVNDEDVVHYAVDGLPEKYNQVCGYMHYQDTFPNLKTVRSLLIAKEMRLKSKADALLMDSSSPMALMTDSGNSRRSSFTPPIKPWKSCFNFAKGTCRFGEGCRFVHDANIKNTNNHGVATKDSTTYDLLAKLLERLGMLLSQAKYATEILQQASMVSCNSSRTPVNTESKLGDDDDLVSDPTLYRSLAGSLQYLTFTRHDISYAVQQLYSSSTTDLVAYSDADWVGCPTTRRSTSGYCVFLGNNLLSWSAKRQPTLSRSNVDAEYPGVTNAVAKTCWLRNLLRELHTPMTSVTIVYCDNVSVVYLSSNPVQHQRTKHVEIDIHFVRDLVAAGQVRVLHVPSRYQFAYIFTKGLPSALFEKFRTSLNIRSPRAPIAEEC
nr:ribonuclease H-like domain-containing protein [Tanacetum cinerariifolium]